MHTIGDSAVSAVGTATEFVAGQRQTTVCYGTNDGDFPDQAFRFRVSFVEHSDNFPLHSHEYSELAIVLGGRAVHRTDVETHPLQTGDVLVLNAGRRHGFEDARELRLCNIMFDPQQFLAGEHELDALMGYRALFDLAPRATGQLAAVERVHLATPELAHVNGVLAALREESERKETGWKASVRYQFLTLVAFLSRVYTHQANRVATPMLQMARVVSHIQENFTRQVSVSELAKLAHLSPSQFQRRFRQIYNATPMQYVNNIRIHSACEMLRDPDKGVAQIALAAGFSTTAFFCAMFKRYMGETPTAYRRRFAHTEFHTKTGLYKPIRGRTREE